MTPLFVMEMANNHGGSIDMGKQIISHFKDLTDKFPCFDYAFKFQRRNLEHLVHPDYQNSDIPYIKKFKHVQLSTDELQELINFTKECGFKTICTPFDEVAVDEISQMGLDYVKVGSCSILDWPLLNKIVELNLPVIASVGGIDFTQIDRVYTFFKNRNIDLSLMHCVGLYPPENYELNLHNITLLKQKYPYTNVGYSSHESRMRQEAGHSVSLALAKGASIFEHHVCISDVNDYSLAPVDYYKLLAQAQSSITKCLPSNTIHGQTRKLNTFKRGAYLNVDIKDRDLITRNMLSFYMPIQNEDHVTVFDCQKYTRFIAKNGIQKGKPLMWEDVVLHNTRHQLLEINKRIKFWLNKYSVVYPEAAKLEISHHYGLDSFFQYGMSSITLINEAYCKKILAILPEQENPEHHHIEKRETFFVLGGSVEITVNGKIHNIKRGDLLTVEPGEKHSIKSKDGAVLEEISSTHNKTDSIYTDDTINKNLDRKTTVYL